MVIVPTFVLAASLLIVAPFLSRVPDHDADTAGSAMARGLSGLLRRLLSTTLAIALFIFALLLIIYNYALAYFGMLDLSEAMNTILIPGFFGDIWLETVIAVLCLLLAVSNKFDLRGNVGGVGLLLVVLPVAAGALSVYRLQPLSAYELMARNPSISTGTSDVSGQEQLDIQSMAEIQSRMSEASGQMATGFSQQAAALDQIAPLLAADSEMTGEEREARIRDLEAYRTILQGATSAAEANRVLLEAQSALLDSYGDFARQAAAAQPVERHISDLPERNESQDSLDQILVKGADYSTVRECCFRVVNVQADDTLNVRLQPTSQSRIVGDLSHADEGIAIQVCQAPSGRLTASEWASALRSGRREPRTWCQVRRGALNGWVNAHYLDILPIEGTLTSEQATTSHSNVSRAAPGSVDERARSIADTDLSVLTASMEELIERRDRWLAFDWYYLVEIERITNSPQMLVLSQSYSRREFAFLVQRMMGFLDIAPTIVTRHPDWSPEDIAAQTEIEWGQRLEGRQRPVVLEIARHQLGEREARARLSALDESMQECVRLLNNQPPSQRPDNVDRRCRAAILNRDVLDD